VPSARRHILCALLLLAAAWACGPAIASARSDALSWPDRRFAPCAAFDGVHGDWYVFGGRAEGAGRHLGDAWGIDLRRSAPRWERLAGADAPGAPPAVRSCAAAYDTDRGRMLVFGGWDGVTATNGVWALTPGPAPRWERLCDASSCGEPPTARRASQAVYDPVGRRLLVFGGLDTQYRNDLWALEFDGAPTWRPLPASGPQPAPRGGHSLTYDAAHRRAWLFGGTTSGPDLGDTWALDPATATWQPVAGGGPAPRSGAVLAHDTAAGRLVLHGGWESGPNRYPRDTWLLDDLAGTPTWKPAQPDTEAPQRRYFGVGAYDRPTRRMVAFGGGIGASALKDLAALELRAGAPPAWHGLAPATPVTARDQVAVGYSAEAGRLLAFGGFGSGTFPGQVDAGTHLADTWQLRAGRDRGRWRPATPRTGAPNPLHREAAAVAADTRRERLVMIGGLEGDEELADVWTAGLRGDRTRWRQLCGPGSCGAGPAARWGGHAVYDPVGDRIVLFGGRRTDGTSFDDVWALSLGGAPLWTRLDVAGAAPAPRWGGAAGYDPVGKRMIVAGGQTGPDAGAVPHGDVWALGLEGAPEWERLEPAGPAPAPRRSAAFAMRDTGDGAELLVTGGLDANAGEHFNDVWALTLSAAGATWSRRAAADCAAPAAPRCRRSASAVYDPRRERLLLVFGRDADRFFGDAWAFSLRDDAWRALPARP